MDLLRPFKRRWYRTAVEGKLLGNVNQRREHVLGNELVIPRGTFSPTQFGDGEWFAKELPKIVGDGSLLEIGTGSGIIARAAAQNGATVTATEEYGGFNEVFTELNRIGIETHWANVYRKIPNARYDNIFWNHPWMDTHPETIPSDVHNHCLYAGFDYKYLDLNRYVRGARRFLSNNSRLLLGTGKYANHKRIRQIARRYGFTPYILKESQPVEGEGRINLEGIGPLRFPLEDRFYILQLVDSQDATFDILKGTPF